MRYFTNLGLALDMFLNVVFGGALNETISRRAAVAAQRGSTPGCMACKLLALLVQPNHCAMTLAGVKTPTSAAIRAGVFLVLLAAAPFAIAHWFL